MWLWLFVKGLNMILDKEGVGEGEEWEGVWNVAMAIFQGFGHDFG